MGNVKQPYLSVLLAVPSVTHSKILKAEKQTQQRSTLFIEIKMHKTTLLYQNVLEEENQSHQAWFPSSGRTMKGIAGGRELLFCG